MAMNVEGFGVVRRTVVATVLIGCLALGIILGMTISPHSGGSPSLRHDPAAAQKAHLQQSEKLVARAPKAATPSTDPVVMKPQAIGDLPAQDDWEILFGEGAWGAEEDETKDNAWTNLFAADAHLDKEFHQLDEMYFEDMSYSYSYSYAYFD